MAITSRESILKVLSAFNPWWKTGTINPRMSKTYKRQKDMMNCFVIRRSVDRSFMSFSMIMGSLFLRNTFVVLSYSIIKVIL